MSSNWLESLFPVPISELAPVCPPCSHPAGLRWHQPTIVHCLQNHCPLYVPWPSHAESSCQRTCL
eukprot:scaffold85731_cov31-Tisochrysis_lutea.AAC.1